MESLFGQTPLLDVTDRPIDLDQLNVSDVLDEACRIIAETDKLLARVDASSATSSSRSCASSQAKQ